MVLMRPWGHTGEPPSIKGDLSGCQAVTLRHMALTFSSNSSQDVESALAPTPKSGLAL